MPICDNEIALSGMVAFSDNCRPLENMLMVLQYLGTVTEGGFMTPKVHGSTLHGGKKIFLVAKLKVVYGLLTWCVFWYCCRFMMKRLGQGTLSVSRDVNSATMNMCLNDVMFERVYL